jgi:hypothetical protein
MKGASGFGRSGILRVNALKHRKRRNPDGGLTMVMGNGHMDH